MTRVLLQYLLPLLGPLAIYLIYMTFVRRKAAKKGEEMPDIERARMFWSIIIGCFLMFAALTTLALTSGEQPGSGDYQAPRMEDGHIVAPKFN